MGGTTKFKFPIPHRRPKEKAHEVQSISAPMTNKASKLLGAAEINIDTASPISSTSDQSRLWETHSAVSGVSGISVTISETTATGTISRSRSPLSTVKESPTVAPGRTNARPTWEQESDIIPRGLGVGDSYAGRSHNPDTTTDASSLRRRRSSSTIVSYYDKTKLPLSISQQTANSAIAKGLPGKAWELLDLDSPRPAPAPPKPDRKKPNRLDLTHLLPNAGASSRRAFTRLTQRGSSMVLGPDLMTRSPSFMSSSSPASSPSECEPKPEKGLRRKLTKESLRSLRGPRPERTSASGPDNNNNNNNNNANLRQRATDTGTLYNLYQHYEDTSFRDTVSGDSGRPASRQGATAADAEPHPPSSASRPGVRQSLSMAPQPVNKLRHQASPSLSAVSRQPYSIFPQEHGHNPVSDPPLAATNTGLASPPADYAASVSSRHTRTSKASKRTDQSFTDFDPNTTSLLSLSSDSEDEDAEPSRTALSIPSVTSLDSVSSPHDGRRPSSTSSSQEPVRKHPKSKFRPSMNPQGQFLAIPENTTSTTAAPPPINPRTSSLTSSLVSAMASSGPRPGAAPSTSTTTSSVRSPSRLSQVSTSTSESIASQISRPHPSPAHPTGPRRASEVHHIAVLQSRAAPTGPGHHEVGSGKEIQHNSPRTRLSPRVGQPTPPISPPIMELATQNQHDAAPEHGGPMLTLSGTGSSEDERFMAVTRQEELLLAALRAKRARMRESHQIAEPVDAGLDSEKDERKASKKESLSSIKTVKAKALQPPPASLHTSGAASDLSEPNGATTMLFPKPPSTKSSSKRHHNTGAKAAKHEQVLLYLGGTTSEAHHGVAESSTESRDFLVDNIERFPPPASSSTATASTSKPSHSRAPSAAAVTSSRTHSKPARQSRSDHGLTQTYIRHASEHTYNRAGQNLRDTPHHNFTPVAERPESPSSYYEDDSQIEQQPEEPPSRARKKAARISAVGMLPEWGDDG